MSESAPVSSSWLVNFSEMETWYFQYILNITIKLSFLHARDLCFWDFVGLLCWGRGFVYLHVCLSACLSVCMSVCLYVCLSVPLLLSTLPPCMREICVLEILLVCCTGGVGLCVCPVARYTACTHSWRSDSSSVAKVSVSPSLTRLKKCRPPSYSAKGTQPIDLSLF